MDVQFHFMKTDQLYSAVVPDEIRPEPELSSVVVFAGVKRTVQYSPGAGAARAMTETAPRGDTPAARGKAELRRRNAAPTLDFASFPTARGETWVHAEPGREGGDAITRIAKSMDVTDGMAGLPRLKLGRELSDGDPREAMERDMVIYYAIADDRTPWSVKFSDAGALGYDGDSRIGNVAFATRTTNAGVIVTCDGPASEATRVQQAAEQVAASLRRI